ncbi:MAG: hypothetical protein P4M14_07330 [Gammaproteobacteria bacterium]|nr:hypothetical protein [Gammaproteobacteria bacterium]
MRDEYQEVCVVRLDPKLKKTDKKTIEKYDSHVRIKMMKSPSSKYSLHDKGKPT